MLQQKIGRTKCPTKVAISSDISKFWSAIVRLPTVICGIFWSFDPPPPHPSGISNSLRGGGYGYFLELHNTKMQQEQFVKY